MNRTRLMFFSLRYTTCWLLIASFSFSLIMHYPVRAFAEDTTAAPGDKSTVTGDEAERANSAEAAEENADSGKDSESPAADAEETRPEKASAPGEGEALKPAGNSRKLSPEEAVKLRQSLKIKSRRKLKQTKEKDAEDSVMKRIFDAAEGKEKERFNVDYAPSEPDPESADEETPFYKHWIFWTIIGVGAVSGVVIGLKYGLSSNKTMSIDISRREQ